MHSVAAMLPVDAADATLAGRLLLHDGPTAVVIRGGVVEDVSRVAPTIADLMELADPASARGERICGIEDLSADQLLAPVDLQAVKAAGVTFAISAIERVIEERARGDYRLASSIRDKLEARIGGGIRSVVPGSGLR